VIPWLKRNYFLLGFVLVNLALAAPAGAGLDDDICTGPGGPIVPCCTDCLFICHCSL
jgi:hypothetical protein